MQQHAEGVDVGGRRDRSTGELFGRGVLRRERAADLARERADLGAGGGLAVGARPHQLRDAEVEQLHVARGSHEHVGGLDVAVHDQARMGVRHRVEHVEKQAKAGLDPEGLRIGMAVDRRAVHELEHEVRLARGRHTGIDEVGDVAGA